MITDIHIEAYCKQYTQTESQVLQELREYTQMNVHGAQMLSDVLVGRLLQFLVRVTQAKLILDLGAFTGYSALSMAEALQEEGMVVTCDQSREVLAIAKSFFAKSKVGHKIRIFEGKINDCIDSIETEIDLVFLDADKMQLVSYLESLYPKLKVGAIVVVDNVLWSGEVLEPVNQRAKAIHTFNKMILKDKRFNNVLLPIRDGLNIIIKN